MRRKTLYKVFICVVLLLLPIFASTLTLKQNRIQKDRLPYLWIWAIDQEKCSGCGICASIVGEDNIEIEDGKAKFTCGDITCCEVLNQAGTMARALSNECISKFKAAEDECPEEAFAFPWAK